MGSQLESPAFSRQLQLRRAALWQAGLALLCTVLATVAPTWSTRLGSLEGLWQLLAITFYLAHTFDIYRLAVAQDYNGRRAACWLVGFAPFASLVALVLLKPVHARQIGGSTAGGT